MPDTRPNIKFSDGICTACINFEKQNTTDWKKRFDELTALCDKYRGCNGNGYDCAIAVSGGKDSHFQVYYMKEVMKMNPLLLIRFDGSIQLLLDNIISFLSFHLTLANGYNILFSL